MREFYMVWVAGRDAPTVFYEHLEDALVRARDLRAECTDREVYVLAPTHCAAGRPIMAIHDGRGGKAQKVEPGPRVTVKKRRVFAHP